MVTEGGADSVGPVVGVCEGKAGSGPGVDHLAGGVVVALFVGSGVCELVGGDVGDEAGVVVVGFSVFPGGVECKLCEALLELSCFVELVWGGVCPVLLLPVVVFCALCEAFAGGGVGVAYAVSEGGFLVCVFSGKYRSSSVFGVGEDGGAPVEGECFLGDVECEEFAVIYVGGCGADGFWEDDGAGQNGCGVGVLPYGGV